MELGTAHAGGICLTTRLAKPHRSDLCNDGGSGTASGGRIPNDKFESHVHTKAIDPKMHRYDAYADMNKRRDSRPSRNMRSLSEVGQEMQDCHGDGMVFTWTAAKHWWYDASYGAAGQWRHVHPGGERKRLAHLR